MTDDTVTKWASAEGRAKEAIKASIYKTDNLFNSSICCLNIFLVSNNLKHRFCCKILDFFKFQFYIRFLIYFTLKTHIYFFNTYEYCLFN